MPCIEQGSPRSVFQLGLIQQNFCYKDGEKSRLADWPHEFIYFSSFSLIEKAAEGKREGGRKGGKYYLTKTKSTGRRGQTRRDLNGFWKADGEVMSNITE